MHAIPENAPSKPCRCALILIALLSMGLSTGCANLGNTLPIDASSAAERDRDAQQGLVEEASDPNELERWSRLSKQGREHLLLGETAQAEETLLEAFAVSKQFRVSDVRRRVSFRNLERVAKRHWQGGADAAARRVLSIIAIESAGLTEFDYPGLSDRLVDLGDLERDRGDLEAAARAYERALDLRTDKSGANSPTLIEVLLRLSSVEIDRGRAAQAVELAERAATLARTHVGEKSGEHIEALLTAATANQTAGNLASAETQLDRALELQREMDSSTFVEAAILNGLAMVHLDAKRLAEAIAHIDNALSILDLLEVKGVDRVAFIDTKAQIRAAQGRADEANALFDEIMLHVDAAPPATQRELFQSYVDFLIDQNRLGEARRIRQQIEALAAPGPETPSEDGREEANSDEAPTDGAAAPSPAAEVSKATLE